jgi:molybdate transport system substrate-binding protein
MRNAWLAALIAPMLALGPVGPKSEILVFAAASLTDVLQDLGRSFEARTGSPVVFSFGGSSDLSRQIDAGAPADVFFSADTAKMDVLEKAGLVRPEDRREFLSNSLVVVIPASSKLEIHTAADLARLPRLALADPAAVPVGVYAKKWLGGLGLWERVEPKIVPTLDVRASLAAVESGSVPAAIVYRTDAAISKSVRIALEVQNGPGILYSVAPLAASKHRAEAEAFVVFLGSDAARAVFMSRGFTFRDAK